MNIAEGVEMLEICSDHGCIYPVFCWDDSNRVLIDAGYPDQLEAFENALARLGFALGDITHIVLTHQDFDHIGCARALLDRAPEARLYAHEAEAPYVRGDRLPVKLQKLEDDFDSLPPERRNMLPKLKAAYQALTVRVDESVSCDTHLPVCGGLRLLHTPGHTPGHLCVYLQNSRTLVTGDALNLADGALIGATPRYTQDVALARESLRILAPLGAQAAVCYHGGLYRGDVSQAIEALLAFTGHAQNEKKRPI